MARSFRSFRYQSIAAFLKAGKLRHHLPALPTGNGEEAFSRIAMQAAKRAHRLAVRLPATVVDALERKEGDEMEIPVAAARAFAVARNPGPEELLKRLRAFRARLSARTRRMPGSFLDPSLISLLRPWPMVTPSGQRTCTMAWSTGTGFGSLEPFRAAGSLSLGGRMCLGDGGDADLAQAGNATERLA
ncbi:AbrB/MazE/SpoVT family DNA-binding domain-containing protein [Methylacidimicrobium sp. B4]|uniref:AbrB/MazE/SpoVT family DNA-binding domain-containing protein n=1 Tax=Methylacidimicrobium sp. B4 TaxID=2796139 RepID=UPI00351C5AE9